jgi:acyl-CoA synthetase (AMP-forming)/AMP-acid ligase II
MAPDPTSTPSACVLDSRRLPTFIFVDEAGTDKPLVLPDCAPIVRELSTTMLGLARPGDVVGLMRPTGPDLVLQWLACVLAGVRPLVLQYPTRKQSRDYWIDSVRHTVTLTGMSLVLTDAHCAGLGLADCVAVHCTDALSIVAPSDSTVEAPVCSDADAFWSLDTFKIIQLSSGTTGPRKAIEFDAAALARHAADFNQTLQLTPQDRIVSWLPLYHDMGFIACFVMPLLLGVDVVMMDPMAWVQQPQRLLDAARRHAATVCFQPNFGYEVLARCAPCSVPTMRWWVSCSEPVSAATSRKFIDFVGAREDQFAACYAMAENVFAVTWAAGVSTRHIGEAQEVVSCGEPIAGVELKLVDGEIWVRSPASMSAYLDGTDLRDADGFYPTGDLGELHEGCLFVAGRKRDLLIQAGRKYLLSDIDLALNQLFPEVKGRAAAVAVDDSRLGTQKPVVLIECKDFFLRDDASLIADSLKGMLGLDPVEVAFVPPRFLTKTSSGKFNRLRCAADWQAVRNERTSRAMRLQAGPPGGEAKAAAMAELRESFPQVDRMLPIGQALDSLSLTVLRIILSDAGMAADTSLSLDQIDALLAERPANQADPGGAAADAAAASRVTAWPAVRPSARKSAVAPDRGAGTIRLVSLADRRIFGHLTEAHVAQLSRLLGAPVTFEHVCLPPSPVVLSDLVFCDHFLPRLGVVDSAARAPFSTVEHTLDKLRDASVILTDDIAEMFFPPMQVYGALSHSMRRTPDADLIAVRWQRYPRQHHRLPVTAAAGIDFPLEDRTALLDMLGRYLDRPMYRIATIKGLARFTRGWEHRTLGSVGGGPGAIELLDPDVFVRRFAAWFRQLGRPVHRSRQPSAATLDMGELAHYCSRYVVAGSVDAVVDAFSSFCVVGQASSVAYLTRLLEARGKPFVRVQSYSQEILAGLVQEFECLVICGPKGRYPITKPAAALMPAQGEWLTLNMPTPELQRLKFYVGRAHAPKTGDDCFYPLVLSRIDTDTSLVKVRQAGSLAKRELRERQALHRAARALGTA